MSHSSTSELYSLTPDKLLEALSSNTQSANADFFANCPIQDNICEVATNLSITIPKERFILFWQSFFEQSIRAKDPFDGLYVCYYYLNLYSPDTIANNESLYAILFHRIENVIVNNNYSDIKYTIIKLLSVLVKTAPAHKLLSPGLFESVSTIFMNDKDTSDDAILFLSNFFDRADALSIMENIIMYVIVPMASFTPPSDAQWHFLCRLFTRYSEAIENMTDFEIMDEHGGYPVFTRSLINDVRLVQQHPPENKHEPDFWAMFLSVFRRIETPQNSKVLQLYGPLINETVLSICFALRSACDFEGKTIDFDAAETWKILLKTNLSEAESAMRMQSGENLEAALAVTNAVANDDVKKIANSIADEYGTTIPIFSILQK